MSDPQHNSSEHTVPLPESFDRRYATRARPYTWGDAPRAVKQIFSKFPLHTAPSESWPAYLTRIERVQRGRKVQFWSNTLSDDARAPSYNVNCLKYQALLLARGVNFEVVRTNSDGAPDGRLPFLLVTNANRQVNVVRSADVEAFIATRTGVEGADGLGQEELNRQAEGLGILEKAVRAAWLYSCYLTPENFRHVVFKLYVASVTHAGLSHYAMLDRLFADAKDEFSKLEYTQDLGRNSWRDAPPPAELDLAISLNKRAGVALEHLVELLNGRTFFSGTTEPGLLDAAVFAYTHLLTQAEFGHGVEWRDARLGDEFRRQEALLRHERAVYKVCFEGGSVESPGRAETQRSNESARAQSLYSESQHSFSEINESAYQDSQHSWEGGWRSTFPSESQHSFEEIHAPSLPTESQRSYEEIREPSPPAVDQEEVGETSGETLPESLVTSAIEVQPEESEPHLATEPQPGPMSQAVDDIVTSSEEVVPTSDEESSAMSSSHLFA